MELLRQAVKVFFYSNCMNYGDVNGADYVAVITSTKS